MPINRARRPLILLCLSLLSLPATAEPPKLNVLFIVVDDLNTFIPAYGNAAVRSPNIDRLAARAVRFDRAYCQYPLCNPSRASFLSGLRPETTKIYDLKIPPRKQMPDAVFLPQLFRQAGYTTVRYGKIFHEGRDDAASWDVTEDVAATGQEKEAMRRRYANAEGGRTPDWMPLDGRDEDTRDGAVAHKSVAAIEQAVKANKPFFVAAGFFKPHLPWTAPRTYFDLYPEAKVDVPRDLPIRGIPPVALITELSPCPQPSSRAAAIAAYYSCITFTDAQMGLLFDTLDRLRLWDNTAVVLFSDHGFHLGDHGGLWAKLTLFEQCARIPLMIAAPGLSPGKASSRLVELIDVYPTLAELAHLTPPTALHGTSLVPLLKDPASARDRPAFTMVYHGDTLGKTIRTERYRYTEWNEGKAGVELYDQQDDPQDFNNLANDPAHKQAVADLQRLLRAR